jgi:thymidine phosphorylase
MKTAELARELAQSMVSTGKRIGVSTTALLTDMNQPLGRMVGNAVEVDESVAALEGRGPADLMEVTLALGAELLVSTNRADSLEAARARLQKTIDDGSAREKFAQMVAAQGGDLDAPRLVAPASDVPAPRSGYVATIDAEQLGEAVIAMRGGRQKLGDELDLSTGFEMRVRLGDQVDQGQPLARLFAGEETSQAGREKLLGAIHIADEKPTVGPLVLDRIV